MKYWKHIDIPGWDIAQQQLLTWIQKYTTFHKGPLFWNPISPLYLLAAAPALGKWVRSNRLLCTYATVLYVAKPDIGIHRDSDTGKARLNLPLLNTETSQTIFYRSESQGDRHVLPNGEVYYRITDGVEVDRVCVDRPTILRISEPHTVICTQPIYPRLVCSLKFNRDVVEFLDDPV